MTAWLSVAVSGLGAGVAVGDCFWFRRWSGCRWLFLVLGAGEKTAGVNVGS